MIDPNQILTDFANAMQPPPKMTVAEHAEANIILPSGESAFSGPLKLARSPYLPFILNQFTNPEVDRIYCCFGTQLGKTLIQLIIMNYIIDCAPGEMLLCYPSNSIAGHISKSRWRPLFNGPNAIPSLAEHTTGGRDDLSLTSYILDRMKIHFSWDSISSVSMWPKKYILKDETKDLDAEVNEAADDRVKNSIDSKIIECSSPLHLDDNIWKGLGLKRDHDAEDEVRNNDDKPGYRLPLYRWTPGDFTSVYFFKFPCPKCGHFQPIYPDMIQWPRECAIRELTTKAFLVCEKCEFNIKEKQRREIVMNAEWQSDNPGSRRVGFHLGSAYSLLSSECTMGEMVARYLRVYRSPNRLKAFINNYLCYPWIEEEHGQNAVNIDLIFDESVNAKYAYTRNNVPEPVILLVAGFDVHKGTIYFSCWGYDEQKNSYLVAWNIFEFDIEVNPDDGLEFIKQQLAMKYHNDYEGVELKIIAAGIDSGYRADIVYDWVRDIKKRLIAIKGQRGEVRAERGMNAYITSSKTIDKKPNGQKIPGGLTLRNVNTGFIKAQFYEQIAAGGVKFPSDVENVILNQIDSEKIVQRKNAKGGYVEFFTPKTRKNTGDDDNFKTGQNHYLDTCVYSIAVREIVLQGKPVRSVAKRYYSDISDDSHDTKSDISDTKNDNATDKKTNKRNRPKGPGRSGKGFVTDY